MLISHNHKFITIDIPKTGTRSFRESIVPLGIIDVIGKPLISEDFYQHDTAAGTKKQFINNGWDWSEYYIFTIVRNPWHRYFSFFKYYYNFAERYKNLDKSISWDEPKIKQGEMCVSLFSDNTYQQVLKNIILNQSAQHEYYCDENNQIMVDHVGRFEDLSNEFSLLCDKVGILYVELKHENKSTSTINIEDIYNQELIDLVAEKERFTIELKDYNI